MTTAQKRGFRFPWGGDPGRDSEPSDSGDAEPNLEERLGGVPDDLGRGPFDVEASGATDAGEAGPDAAADDSEVGSVAAAVATATAVAAPQSTSADEPAAEASAADEPMAAAAAAAQAGEAAPTPAGAAWPESDRRSAGRAAAADRPAARPTGKANPLVAGLVRAMRDAAKTARDEAVTTLRAEAAARAEAIRTDGATAVANLRKTADADVAAVREWSKAEMARVREETESRIAARKEQLITETDDQARATEATLASLGEAISGYEVEAAAFFDRLLAEEDPARLAGLAERMPSPPTLDAFGGTSPAPASTPATRASSHDADPADDATAASVRAEGAPPDEPSPSGSVPAQAHEAAAAPPEGVAQAVAEAPAMADAQAATDAPATADNPATADSAATPDAPAEPDALDAEAAAAAEAAALAGLDSQTQVIVSGLSGVATIAAFKAALLQHPGVNAVSVNAGNDGDCLFTVTHTGDTDVRTVVRDMPPFQTRLIADDGSTVVVVAHESAA